jgi:hypothetical protein
VNESKAPKSANLGALCNTMMQFGRRLVAIVSLVGLLISQTSAGLLAAVRCPASACSKCHCHEGESCCACCGCGDDDDAASEQASSSLQEAPSKSPAPQDSGCPRGCTYCSATKTIGCFSGTLHALEIANLAAPLVEASPSMPSAHPGKLIRPPRG